MAKAKLKAKERPVGIPPQDSTTNTPSIPPGMTAKDLSPEKRIELFSAEFETFKKHAIDTYGLEIAVELVGMPRAIIPRIVVNDLLKNPDGNTQNNTNPQA